MAQLSESYDGMREGGREEYGGDLIQNQTSVAGVKSIQT